MIIAGVALKALTVLFIATCASFPESRTVLRRDVASTKTVVTAR